MSKLADPIHALALSATIDVLRGMLGEAIDYLVQEEHLAALGTLILFDDQSPPFRWPCGPTGAAKASGAALCPH